MDLHLKGRRALVTGASKGIGEAIALMLAEEGCDLVLVARSAPALEAVRQKIEARFRVGVETCALDVGAAGSAAHLADAFTHIDILVNNAGAIPPGSLDEIDEPAWRAGWDLKVFGYINLCRAFYAALRQRGGGVIVNVIGHAGERMNSQYIAGSSGNASLIAFTRALGGTSHRDGIRVVGVNPGPVATDRHRVVAKRQALARFGSEDRWQEFDRSLPFGRAGEAAEIAAMVAFLASDRSAYTTGTVVTIDGGLAGTS